MATSSMFRGTGGPANTQTGGTTALTDVADLWLRRKSHSESLKENHQSDWSRYWRWYMNWVQALEDPSDWWRSNAPDPQAFKVLETLIPKSILGMWGRQRNFTVVGGEASDAPAARKAEALLNYFIKRTELFPKLLECMKYVHIMGHAWGKVVWRQDYEEVVRDMMVDAFDDAGGYAGQRRERLVGSREIYNDPDFQWCRLDKVWPDPTGKGRWFIEGIDTTLEELEESNDAFAARTGRPLYRNLALLARHGDASSSREAFDERQEAFGIPAENEEPADVDGQRVRLMQCWGWVPRERRGPDGNAWRLTVIANDMVEIRDEAVPTPDNRPPYFPIRSVVVPGRLYGESILRWIGPQIDLKSKLANMRMDEAMLGVWQQYVYDRDAVTSNQMLFQPGGAVPIDAQGKSIRDVFAVIERRPILSEAYVEDQTRERTIEDTSAATPQQQGVADTSRQTATEIQTLTARGDQRFLLQNMYHDHTFKRELLVRALKWYQKQLPPGRLVRITGEDVGEGGAEVPIDISELDVPMDIDVQAGVDAFGREARIQSVTEFVQLAGVEPFAPYINAGSLMKQLAEDRGWVDPHRFVRSEQEVQQAQQAAMQQQVQTAQMQAALEAQTKIAVEQAKAAGQQQAEQQAMQIELAKAQMDIQLREKELELKDVEMQLAIAGKSLELEMQREKLEMELEALRAKAAVELRTQTAKSEIAVESARDMAVEKRKAAAAQRSAAPAKRPKPR